MGGQGFFYLKMWSERFLKKKKGLRRRVVSHHDGLLSGVLRSYILPPRCVWLTGCSIDFCLQAVSDWLAAALISASKLCLTDSLQHWFLRMCYNMIVWRRKAMFTWWSFVADLHHCLMRMFCAVKKWGRKALCRRWPLAALSSEDGPCCKTMTKKGYQLWKKEGKQKEKNYTWMLTF